MGHANEEMLRGSYAAYKAQDKDAIASLFTEDAFVIVPGEGGLSGTYRGRDESAALFARVWTQASDGLELDIHEVLANDHHSLDIVKVTAQRGGDRYEWETHVHELTDGASAGVFVYVNDDAPGVAYFSP